MRLGNRALYIRRLEWRGFGGFGLAHKVRVRSYRRSQVFFLYIPKMAIPTPTSQVGEMHRTALVCVLPVPQRKRHPNSGCITEYINGHLSCILSEPHSPHL